MARRDLEKPKERIQSYLVTNAKYDLSRWIVGTVIVNGMIATLPRFTA